MTTFVRTQRGVLLNLGSALTIQTFEVNEPGGRCGITAQITATDWVILGEYPTLVAASAALEWLLEEARVSDLVNLNDYRPKR